MTMRTLMSIIVVVLTGQLYAHETLTSHLQQAALREIAQCKTEQCVDGVLNALDYSDPAVRLVRAAKLSTLNASSAECALLDAIPKDQVSFWFCYSITSPRLKDFDVVSRLYYSYFPAAAKAVAATGMRVPEFLLLQRFADGEVAALVAEQIDYVGEQNRDAYCAARRSLRPSVRRRLRDICDSK